MMVPRKWSLIFLLANRSADEISRESQQAPLSNSADSCDELFVLDLSSKFLCAQHIACPCHVVCGPVLVVMKTEGLSIMCWKLFLCPVRVSTQCQCSSIASLKYMPDLPAECLFVVGNIQETMYSIEGPWWKLLWPKLNEAHIWTFFVLLPTLAALTRCSSMSCCNL